MLIEKNEVKSDYLVLGFWWTFFWIVVIPIISIVTNIMTKAVILNLVSDEFQKSILENPVNGFVLSICHCITLIVFGLLVLVIITLKKNSNIKHYLGLKTVSLKTVGLWLLVLCIFLVSFDAILYFMEKLTVPEFVMQIFQTRDSTWLLILGIAIAAPINEELFFRGFLFSVFPSSFLGVIGAIFLPAFIWAIIHRQYEMPEIVFIFLLGLLLGVARVKSGSVLLPIVLHSFVSLIAIAKVAFIS